jgi:putative lipase involved disintegration of autophagic bodies
MPLSEVFWVAFITTMTGFVLKLVSMAYKSKCKTCKVCCIEVVRDTEAEAEIDELRITTLPPPPPNSPTNRTDSFNQL